MSLGKIRQDEHILDSGFRRNGALERRKNIINPGLLKRLALVSITLIGIAAVVSGSLSCSPGVYSGKVETVTISENPGETKTLLYIAAERGLFTANGLNIVFKNYVTGAAAISGMLKGEVDLATGSEFVIVGNVLKKEDISVIASIDKFQNSYIIGRIDKGIRDITDLKGKRIGLPRQTSAEFYLGRFLDLHDISIRQVTLVDLNPAQSVEAIVNGSVDAVSIFQQDINTIRQRLGDGVVVWPAQSGQPGYFNIIGAGTWVAGHPEVINRLLRSLIQAEDYVVNHPDEAKVIVKKRLQYDDAYINAFWPGYQFSVSLERGLIAAMEDQARWMIANNLTDEKQIPDFAKYIYLDGLKKVKPELVNIR